MAKKLKIKTGESAKLYDWFTKFKDEYKIAFFSCYKDFGNPFRQDVEASGWAYDQIVINNSELMICELINDNFILVMKNSSYHKISDSILELYIFAMSILNQFQIGKLESPSSVGE